MAFVTRRGDRFEIRESSHTAHGPRAKTLATFRELTDPVLDKAASRATRPFDRDAVRRRAVEAGAPVGPGVAFESARLLAGELARGRRLPPALAAHLVEALEPSPRATLDSLDDVAGWIGEPPERRGRALWQLLELADALPKKRRRGRIEFPRVTSTTQ